MDDERRHITRLASALRRTRHRVAEAIIRRRSRQFASGPGVSTRPTRELTELPTENSIRAQRLVAG
jgi:hypothetical protein